MDKNGSTVVAALLKATATDDFDLKLLNLREPEVNTEFGQQLYRREKANAASRGIEVVKGGITDIDEQKSVLLPFLLAKRTCPAFFTFLCQGDTFCCYFPEGDTRGQVFVGQESRVEGQKSDGEPAGAHRQCEAGRQRTADLGLRNRLSRSDGRSAACGRSVAGMEMQFRNDYWPPPGRGE